MAWCLGQSQGSAEAAVNSDSSISTQEAGCHPECGEGTPCEGAGPGPDRPGGSPASAPLPGRAPPTSKRTPVEDPTPLSASQTGIKYTQPPPDSWGGRNTLHTPVQPCSGHPWGKVLAKLLNI